MESVAIYGGSFDPIHNGHIAVANYVIKSFPIEKLIFLPSKIHAFKGEINQISDNDRLHILNLVTKKNKKLLIDDFEINNKQDINFSYDYLRHIEGKYDKIYFVIGSDNLAHFSKWKNWQKILDICKIISYERPFYPNEIPKELINYQDQFILVKDKLFDISSSEIKEGKIEKELFPEDVYQYIIKKRLYLR